MSKKAATTSVVSSITRSGTTFTAKNSSGTQLFTFTQQDNDTTTGTSYNAGSCPDNTTFATNGSVKRAYDKLNGKIYYFSKSVTTNEVGIANLGLSTTMNMLVAWTNLGIVMPFQSGDNWYIKVSEWNKAAWSACNSIINSTIVVNGITISAQ